MLTRRIAVVMLGDDRARERLVKALERSGLVLPLISREVSERLSVTILAGTLNDDKDIYIYALASSATDTLREHYCRMSSVIVIVVDLEDPRSCLSYRSSSSTPSLTCGRNMSVHFSSWLGESACPRLT